MVDAEGYRELARIGQIWATKVEDVEPHGRFSARVYCREETEVRWFRGSAVVYGLCKSCSDAEANQRRDMRDKAAVQSGRRER